MASYVRVRPASQGGPCAVRHPEYQEFIVPNPAHRYSANDPLVKAYPWLFVSDETVSENGSKVEQATRAPGERRTTKRS